MAGELADAVKFDRIQSSSAKVLLRRGAKIVDVCRNSVARDLLRRRPRAWRSIPAAPGMVEDRVLPTPTRCSVHPHRTDVKKATALAVALGEIPAHAYRSFDVVLVPALDLPAVFPLGGQGPG